MVATKKAADLQLAFDVGHSSIGWCVLQAADSKAAPELLGTGVVTFEADDCLANKRRIYRRQRRHVRSTRQRVARIEALLAHVGVLRRDELSAKHRQAGGHSAPWMLAARILKSDGAENTLLSWTQLWDVIRWYAHNRGYDGNQRWTENEMADTDSGNDAEKVANAIELMNEHSTQTMAETLVAVLGLDIDGEKKSSRVRFKAKSAAFPRARVESEVKRILNAHIGHLSGMTESLISLLMARRLSREQRTYLREAGIPLHARYEGGLLFGQLLPRFDNRIISICPITGEKVPTRNCPEFLQFRWAMLLANIRISTSEKAELRPLSIQERKELDTLMRPQGHLTKTMLKRAMKSFPNYCRDNLDTLLMHPDAEEALLFDPVTQLTNSPKLKMLWAALPPRAQKRARDAWGRGKTLTPADLRSICQNLGEGTEGLDAAISDRIDTARARQKRDDSIPTKEALLNEAFSVKRLSGRAPYSRSVLKRTHEEVFLGKHPKERDGCLYLDDAKRRKQLNRRIEEQTNNHLIRHRLLVLHRLLADIISEPRFANGDRTRVSRVTIEVNRDMRELSGKTAKQIEQDLALRLSNHLKVSKKLEECFAGQTYNGTPVSISPGLIRKARIADDLEWQCPYTGVNFEPIDLVSRRVDKDHIIPRSQRLSDSLDSLVITFSEINKWKGNRTAAQFIEEEQGKQVPGIPNLSIRTLKEYTAWAESLETSKGHADDKRRKANRRELLLLRRYEETSKSFLPGDLTQTSQLTRLGAQLLERYFSDIPTPPMVVSIPGIVTGTVRKAWDLIGCLSLAAPLALNENGAIKTKTEIRGITHLHHALDACVLAYISLLLPRDGGLWELMIKRNPSEAEREKLRASGFFDFDSQGRFELRDLPKTWKESIRNRLAEKRVVQHVPADMSGLRVEENTRGVEKVENGRVHLRQQSRDAKTGAIEIKRTKESAEKVIGLNPANGTGKLRMANGVRVITDNFGVALLEHAEAGTPNFVVIPWHKVWHRIGELKKRNAGITPRILRNGMLIHMPRGGYAGTWRIFSVKNNASGMAVDMAWPDVVRLKNKTPGHKINVSLKTLVGDGLEMVETGLTGIPSM